MKIAILDDTFDTLRGLPCFRKLAGHDVRVFHDHVQDTEALAARLRDVEVLVLMRERTQIRADLVARLDKRGSGTPCVARPWASTATGASAPPSLAMGGAFGMHVLVWSGEASRRRAAAAGHDVALAREHLYGESDVLSLHLRLVDATRASIGAADLSLMKPSALLVNTSRAGLIAPGALAEALARGRPGRAAVDVFEEEPMRDPHHPLLQLPNVVATPHIGYVTHEELELQFSDVFDQILAYAAGRPINVVNPIEGAREVTRTR